MNKPKISIVAGNGLSISFGHFSGLAHHWNSQEPLSWPIDCPSHRHNFLNSLPRLKALHDKYIEHPDFDVFAKALDNATCTKHDIDPFITPLEARHFLTIAFSNYSNKQIELLETCKEWPWYKWIELHKGNIVSAFSLNYDLLLESIFDGVALQYFSLQVNHHGHGIPLVKPHGSVDFEIHPSSISYKPNYPLTNFVDLNDTPIIRLEANKLIYPRSQPLCIIPNESNKYSGYQWVAPANRLFNEEVSKCTHCIFIGISYFECDRPELDSILDRIPISAQIIVANPNPPQEFMERLKGRPVMIWSSYNGPLDSKGNLFTLKDIKTGNLLRNCFCRSGLSYQYCCGAKLL
ncbi:hypothetical protein [Pseudomonas benzenivorans]|uniref:hypothetical protein n=1 Tax=Pseudomonas benzenivorans TaxID=556533 RepID=UPI003516870B